MATEVKVCASADLPEGGSRQCDVGGRKVALFRAGGVPFALDGVCPHRGGPLGEGKVDGGVVTCPFHGWRFEVRTGSCLNVPGKVQASFPVREEGGSVLVEV